jgi:glycerol-1-phosphate dehydrogenase [NAD(P)+]
VLEELPAMAASLMPARGGSPVAVLTDRVVKRRAGSDLLPLVVELLGGPGRVRVIAVEGGEGGRVHADAQTIDRVTEEAKGSAGLVTVGSGTLADIGKAASVALSGLPHVVVQTATSVNGFTDDQSVLLVKGVKRTTPTRWPDALVADAEVLLGAPLALNLAGVGDLAAMFTAPADWQFAHALGMADSYSATVVDLVRVHGQHVLAAAGGLARSEPAAVTTLAEVLALSGISMGVAGTTAPASGMEHTVSHLIEMSMNRRGREAAYHGATVGVTSILAARLWWKVRARLEADPRPSLSFPSPDVMDARVRDAFAALDPSGEMGEECWRLYAKKLERWTANRARLEGADWKSIAVHVGQHLIEPLELAGALGSAGAPVLLSQLDPPVDAELGRWALSNCHLMRDRFTVADLAFFMGMWDAGAVDEVLS